MKFNLLLSILCVLLVAFLFSCGSMSTTASKKILTEAECNEKENMLWYDNACWHGADEVESGYIEVEDIPAAVEEYEQALKNSYVKIGSELYPVLDLLVEDVSLTEVFLAILFEVEGNLHTIFFSVSSLKLERSMSGKMVEFEINYITESIFALDADSEVISTGGKINWTVNMRDKEEYVFTVNATGSLSDGKNLEIQLDSLVAGSGGDFTISVEGDTATISGDLGMRAYIELKKLDGNPDIKRLVLFNVPGSVNDSINMNTGFLIRNNGWTTYVPSDSMIASGGVDLFAAGKERIVEKGAKLGIHSWCCFLDDGADELPKNHPSHQFQLNYFTTMLGDDLGPKFYFRTLEAAPAAEIHYMSTEEMLEYELATKIIDP